MLTNVYPSVYQLELKLPDNPLRVINTYLIKGSVRNLIIDTGFNTEDTRKTLLDAMDELKMTRDQTDLLVTHLHSDHSGLAAHLGKVGMTVYTGKKDGALLNEMTRRSYWKKFEELNLLMGMAQDHITFEEHPGFKYCPKETVDYHLLVEGDVIDLGDFRFSVLDIPGHTPGHIGLYEADKQLLFSGDHILDRITPNIAFWGFEQDILAVYLNSLDKVRPLCVDYCFTAHRNILRDHTRRIDELKGHHVKRLAEIMAILDSGPKTVRQIAASMKWDLRIESWELFPANQKWFAAGEALSHLEHLTATGLSKKQLENGILYYRRG